VLGAVAKLIGAYVDSLQFGLFRPDLGAHFVGSPYDFFLVKNKLPRRPDPNESDLAYARRLRGELAKLVDPAWITPADWTFKFHEQKFEFGPRELED
jgi:hypothetical protein